MCYHSEQERGWRFVAKRDFNTAGGATGSWGWEVISPA